MSCYIDSNLGKEEQVIFRAKLHWAMLLPRIILFAVIAVVGVAEAGAILILPVILVGVAALIPLIITLYTTELGFTNRRVIGKLGLINTQSMDSPLNKLNNVTVSSGLFGKILGYGNVKVTTSSGAYDYKGIVQPEVFRSALMQHIDLFDEERVKKQAMEMASAMKGAN